MGNGTWQREVSCKVTSIIVWTSKRTTDGERGTVVLVPDGTSDDVCHSRVIYDNLFTYVITRWWDRNEGVEGTDGREEGKVGTRSGEVQGGGNGDLRRGGGTNLVRTRLWTSRSLSRPEDT